MMVSSHKKSTELQLRQSAEIVRFTDESIAKRLTSMGVLPGSKVVLLHRKPFRGGYCFKIDNHKLALRFVEAEQIIVNI